MVGMMVMMVMIVVVVVIVVIVVVVPLCHPCAGRDPLSSRRRPGSHPLIHSSTYPQINFNGFTQGVSGFSKSEERKSVTSET
jgi:hypothetical protein